MSSFLSRNGGSGACARMRIKTPRVVTGPYLCGPSLGDQLRVVLRLEVTVQ